MPNSKKLSPDQLESAQAIVKKNSTNVPVDQCFIENSPTAVGQVLVVTGLNTGSHSLGWGANVVSGAASGDLSGTYPNPEVVAVTETGGPTQRSIGAIPINTVLTCDGAGNIVGVASVPPGAHTHAAADVTTGQLSLARGGTAANLSATGGAGFVVKQSGVGVPLTSAALVAADLPTHTHVRQDVTTLDDTNYYVGAGPHLISPWENLHHIDTTAAAVVDIDAAWQTAFSGGGTFTIFNTGVNSLTIFPPLGWTVDNGAASLVIPAGKSVSLNFPNAGTPDIRVVGGTHVAGAGEVNTASNVNVGGVGVFNAKIGVDLKFRGINAASSKISVALDVPNNEIDIDVVESNLSSIPIASLASIPANTIIANATAGAASPTAVATAPTSLVGRDAGNITNISLNTTLSMDGANMLRRAALIGDVTAPVGSNATTIANSAVTLAKIQNAAANSKLLGSGSAGVGLPYSEITLGSGLSMAGTTLSSISSGEANTASNVGAGVGVFKVKTGVDLEFKSLVAGAGVTVTPGVNDVTIASTSAVTPQIITLSPLPFSTASIAYILVAELVLDGTLVIGAPLTVYTHISTNPGQISLDVYDLTNAVSLGSLLITPLTGIVSWPIVPWIGPAVIQFLVRKNLGAGPLTVSPVTLHAG